MVKIDFDHAGLRHSQFLSGTCIANEVSLAYPFDTLSARSMCCDVWVTGRPALGGSSSALPSHNVAPSTLIVLLLCFGTNT